jgi:hypothetical protein
MLLLALLLAPFVVLATRAVANPAPNFENATGITIPIAKRIRVGSNATVNIVQRDDMRLRLLLGRGQNLKSLSPGVLLNEVLGATYAATIGIGQPPTYCESCQFLPHMVSYILILDQLLVDTGSANTWVGANKSYVITNSSMKTSDSFVSIMSCHGIPVSSN